MSAMSATAKVRQGKSKERTGPSSVFSIGYEGKALAAFMDQLVEARVEQLLDVRYNAMSRKKGFGKNQLTQACIENNIQYIHIPELGIPTELRTNLRTQQDYDTLFILYRNTILRQSTVYVKQAAQFASEKASAFMCFERDINCCHRKSLVDAVAKVTGLPVTHL